MGIKNRQKWAYVYLAPYFLVFALFSMFPIIYTFWLSFNHMQPLTGDLTWAGLTHYRRMLESRFFYESIWNTILIWLMSIIPQLTIAYTISLLLSNKWVRGRFWLRNIYYFPNLVVPVTIGLLFGALFSYPGGSINQVLNLFGWDSVHFSQDPMLARMAIAIAIMWRNFALTLSSLLRGLILFQRRSMKPPRLTAVHLGRRSHGLPCP
ncbi:MAG: sugar ABC transporter permease [Defluviitaleaceae bacterium]|nr:sugar ABC transporter permease [Defluviitaleaceae bacterium]